MRARFSLQRPSEKDYTRLDRVTQTSCSTLNMGYMAGVYARQQKRDYAMTNRTTGMTSNTLFP